MSVHNIYSFIYLCQNLSETVLLRHSESLFFAWMDEVGWPSSRSNTSLEMSISVEETDEDKLFS